MEPEPGSEMDTNQHFPCLSDFLPPRDKLLRNALEWTADTDFDDFLDINPSPSQHQYLTRLQKKLSVDSIHYKVITAVILNCLAGRDLSTDAILSEFRDEILSANPSAPQISDKRGRGGHDIVLDYLRQQVTNIQRLYDTLKEWSVFAGEGEVGITEPIVIYRGFNMSRYNLLFDLNDGRYFRNTLKTIKRGEVITIPTFLSTSVIHDSALRFASNGGYFWEITVPKDKLHEFKYVYFGRDIDLGALSPGVTPEAEILLNIGTQLEYSGEETMDVVVAANTITLTKQCFVFVGYDKDIDLGYLHVCLDRALSDYSSKKPRTAAKERKKSKKRTKSRKRKRRFKKRKRRSKKRRRSRKSKRRVKSFKK